MRIELSIDFALLYSAPNKIHTPYRAILFTSYRQRNNLTSGHLEGDILVGEGHRILPSLVAPLNILLAGITHIDNFEATRPSVRSSGELKLIISRSEGSPGPDGRVSAANPARFHYLSLFFIISPVPRIEENGNASSALHFAVVSVAMPKHRT